MPEQISKYPDVTLDVLKGAGARCGEGAPQNILKQCPAERFCALPTGEVCVYGISDIPQMTQITPAELARVVAPAGQRGDDISLSGTQGVMLGVVFLLGLALGKFWQKAGRRD